MIVDFHEVLSLDRLFASFTSLYVLQGVHWITHGKLVRVFTPNLGGILRYMGVIKFVFLVY